MNEKAETASKPETKANATPTNRPRGNGKRRRWPFLLLLLFLVAAAGVLVYRQFPLGGTMPSPAPSSKSVAKVIHAPPAALSHPEKHAQPSDNVPEKHASQRQDHTTGASTALSAGSPSPEATEAMMQAMDALRAQIASLQQQLEDMQQGMLRQQRMQLELRLRWIADPASRLPDMAMAWQEIALLPMLDEERRGVAEKMHALAEQDSMKLMQLRKHLAQLAERLATPVYEDVLPRPEQAWLAWIVGQFHLRKAPDAELRERSSLREEILDIQGRLAAEQWPEQQHWQRIRARLVLLDSDGQVAFPESFDVFRQHKLEMRQTAQQWMAGGS